MMATAVVNKIIPFSSVDGTGNRTAVFLQGCNIDCKYCHNPETRGKCTNCGKCVEHCPAGALSLKEGVVVFDEKKCCKCDTCIKVCPHSSSPRTVVMSASEVFQCVMKQVPFIRGVTVSGGECMLQTEFLTQLFALCKREGLSTLIDSNGTIDFESCKELLDVTDGVMLDIKAFAESDHIAVTSATNKTVLKNARFLAEMGKLCEVRAVIVPDLYDVEKSVTEMAKFLAPLSKFGKFKVKLIKYRPMGVRKMYKHFAVPSEELMQHLAEIVKKSGLEVFVV